MNVRKILKCDQCNVESVCICLDCSMILCSDHAVSTGHVWNKAARKWICPGPPKIAAQADREYSTRLDAQRATLEFSQASKRPLDAGKQSIEDSPLFGGPRQQTMF